MDKKKCSICKKELPVSQFFKDRRYFNIYASRCKKCRNKINCEFRNSDKGKKYFREYIRKYRETDKYKKWQLNYQNKNREYAKLQQRFYRSLSKHQKKYQARWMTRGAIKRNIIKKQPCQECGSINKIEAHHYLGYEEKHWLDVEWLCSECHGKKHRI